MHASLQRLLEGPLELHPPDPNTFTQLHNPGLLCSSPMAPGGSTHLTLSVRRSSGPSSPSSYATSCRPLALSKPTTCAQQGLPGSAQRLGVVCSGYNAELAARVKPHIAGCKAVSKWLAAHTVARGRYNAQQRGRCAPPQNRRPGRRASTRRHASPPQSAPPAAQALHRNKAGGMQKRRLVSCMQWQQLLLCNGSRKLLREHAWHATSTCSPWLLLTPCPATQVPLAPLSAYPCPGLGRRPRAPPAGSATSAPQPPPQSTRPRHHRTAAAPCPDGGRSPRSEAAVGAEASRLAGRMQEKRGWGAGNSGQAC